MNIKGALVERDCVVSDLMDQVREARAEVARLEDLRRWRPMSEKPLAASVLVRQSRVPRRAATSSFDLEEGEWAWPRHSTETSYEWTYIPGQEPKEEV